MEKIVHLINIRDTTALNGFEYDPADFNLGTPPADVTMTVAVPGVTYDSVGGHLSGEDETDTENTLTWFNVTGLELGAHGTDLPVQVIPGFITMACVYQGHAGVLIVPLAP